MTASEEGLYRCLAVNSEGSAEVRVQVDVIGGGAVGAGEYKTCHIELTSVLIGFCWLLICLNHEAAGQTVILCFEACNCL